MLENITLNQIKEMCNKGLKVRNASFKHGENLTDEFLKPIKEALISKGVKPFAISINEKIDNCPFNVDIV